MDLQQQEDQVNSQNNSQTQNEADSRFKFITNVEEVAQATDEIKDNYKKLLSVIETLDDRVSEVIQSHEKDFFSAFKHRLTRIKGEMMELKDQASKEKLKHKNEKRMIELEKERDWFRKEALKLDKMCRDHKRQLNKMKVTLENTQEDRDFFRIQLFKAKKVNKAMIIELEKYRDGKNIIFEEEEESVQPQLALEAEPQREESLSEIFQPLAIKQEGEEAAVMVEDYEQQKDRPIASRETQRTKAGSYREEFSLQDEVLQENKEMKMREEMYEETIRHLRNQMDLLKKSSVKLKRDKVKFSQDKTDLEEFFLSCIEEVKKDILKRRALSRSQSAKKVIKNVATHSDGGSSMRRLKETGKLADFTNTDKRKVIELLLSNESILLFLYEKLFPSTRNTAAQVQARPMTGLHPPKFQPQPARFTMENGKNFSQKAKQMFSTKQRAQTAFGARKRPQKKDRLFSAHPNAAAVANSLNEEMEQSEMGPAGVKIPAMSFLSKQNQPMHVQNYIANVNVNITHSNSSANMKQ